MKKIFGVIIIALGALVIFQTGPKEELSKKLTVPVTDEEPSRLSTEKEKTNQQVKTVAKVEAPLETSEKNSLFSKLLKEFQLPNRETVEQEVFNDPHGTPPTVLKTALQLRDLYQSVESPKEATALMSQLTQCSDQNNADHLTSLSITCYEMAQRLADQYPDQLQQEWISMQDRLSDRVQMILSIKKKRL